ncbi:hypothetical protein [Acinetobacter sp. TGL-Y2]|uniref:hypothetical protein n=1 Tax=Acinetobacter sp. TGL-Y2 TaxID=1407071 RepID=UPI001488B491|nr:hypothetical protein [Acinetobacter sp. TGL-Y2]
MIKNIELLCIYNKLNFVLILKNYKKGKSMAGGSQIIINKNGITFITPAKFEAKAGQHKFVGGKKVLNDLPILPLPILSKTECPLSFKFGKNPTSNNQSNFTDKNSIKSRESGSLYLNQYPPQPTSAASLKQNVQSYPPIPIIDLSKIKGHSCTIIPSFKNKVTLPNLSGTYYKTKYPAGGPDGVTYSPEHEKYKAQYHIDIDQKGQKISVPIRNFAVAKGRLVDLEFDQNKNTLTASIKIKLFACKVIDLVTGEEIEYNSDIHSGIQDNFKFEKRELTEELISIVKEKERLVNSILNKDGFYLSPKNCHLSGGCTCKVAVIFKVEYSFTATKPSVFGSKDDEVFFFKFAKRQDAKHWSEFEVKYVTTTTPTSYSYENGSVVTKGGELIKEKQIFETATIFCHESAHLFGFPDEYFANGGAVHKMYVGSDNYIDVKIIEPENDWKRHAQGNLMSSPNPNQLPLIHAYYYEEYRKIFEQQTRLEWEIKRI